MTQVRQDLRTSQEDADLWLDHGPVKYAPHKILLSEEGDLLAAYYANSHISIWDMRKKTKRHPIGVGLNGALGWTFSADGKLLVTSHMDGSFKTWDMIDGKMVAELRGHPGTVVALACSPDNTGLVSSCTGCTILRWTKDAWRRH